MEVSPRINAPDLLAHEICFGIVWDVLVTRKKKGLAF
jgi:hypothetical protein